jgi:hypothetical protein
MNQNQFNTHVNKIFFGSIIWGAFYLHLFFNATRWNETYLGSRLGVPFSYELVYAIQIVFFLFLNFNLFHYTIGKKYSAFDVDRFFRILIFIIIILILVQGVTLYFELPFHYGVIGYLVGRGELIHITAGTQVHLYIMYLAGLILSSIYISGVLVFLYQLYKMNQQLPFYIWLRIGIVLFIYGYTLGYSEAGFSFITLGLCTLYILIAYLIYIKTKYSIKALLVSLILLFLL